MPRAEPVMDRILKRYRVDDVTGCHVWTGKLTARGYGAIQHRNTNRVAHKVRYEHEVGAVPPGMQLDHLCRNRACINLDHLEVVTLRTNVLRGIGPTAQNARKTVCARGHALAGDNVYIRPSQGGRRCRTCHQEDQCRRRALFGDKWNARRRELRAQKRGGTQ